MSLVLTLLTPAELARVALLQPALRNAVPAIVQDIEQATGKAVTIPPHGGWRSSASQAALYAARASNPYPVAAPGTSYHEFGGAVDLDIIGGTDADYQTMRDIVQGTYGLVSGYPGDQVHVRLNESLAQVQADWQAVTSSRWSWGLIAAGIVVGAVVLTGNEE